MKKAKSNAITKIGSACYSFQILYLTEKYKNANIFLISGGS